MSAVTIRVVEGAEARALLADSTFRHQWQTLQDCCPWATGFQGPGFVTTWYDTYGTTAAPLVILGRDGADSLCGLLTLATLTDGDVVPAGGRQAEYHAWITTPGRASSFPALALEAVRSRIGIKPLRFQYLPANTPLDWLPTANDLKVTVEDVPRPLMAISLEAIEESWKKKQNKSRLSRLKKLGELTFDRLSADSLGADIRDIGLIYDLRQAAIGSSRPFTDDPLKAAFHVNLMKVPGLLHATVLKVGGSLISAQLGICSRDVVHVGVLAHSPFHARHSPGKLQLMFLSKLMAEEGFVTLDLTPGGGWKERSATSFDVVKRLTLFGSSAAFRRARYSERVQGLGKAILSRAGVSPSSARNVISGIRSKGIRRIPAALLGRVRAVSGRTVELRAYAMPLPAPKSESTAIARRDAIEDLLKFTEAPDSSSRAEFFQRALGRLEEGHHSYTVVQDGRLVHYGWLAEGQERGVMDEVHQPFTYPAGSVALYDFYTHPDFRGRGLYASTLRQMLAEVSDRGHQQAYIFVTAENTPSRKVIERLGFTYALSLFERSSLGRTTQWRSDGPVETIAVPKDETGPETTPSSTPPGDSVR